MVVSVGNAIHSDGGDGNSRAPSIINISDREASEREKFPRAVAKMAISQICESAGFHSIQRSALETLSDIAIRYLCDLGKTSQLYANLSGRTQSNALDAVAALEDMSGASFSEPHNLASSSVCMKELIRFVNYAEELPFAKPLPHFPMWRTHKPPPSFAQRDEDPPKPHIPPWLPAFPNPQAYASAPVQNEDRKDVHMENSEQSQQKQKTEQSLVALRFRLCTSGASASGDISAPHTANNVASMGTSPPSASRTIPSEQQEPGKLDSEGLPSKAKGGKRPAVCTHNPFLAPALPSGSKPISTWFFDDMKPPSPAPSTKKIIAPAVHSVLDAFRPAPGFVSSNSQEAFEMSKPRILPSLKNRSPVRIGLRKKETKWECMQMTNNERDEKRKRAHETLAQYFYGDDDDTR